VRIVTYNIKAAMSDDGRSQMGLLGSTCAGFGADILALQEVDRWAWRCRLADQVKVVARATGLVPAFAEAARRFPVRRYGNALFVRGGLAGSETFLLPRPADGEQRVGLLATAQVEGFGPVSVAATHLSFRRGEGAIQLEALVERLGQRPGPRVLLGDLNLDPEFAEPILTRAGYTVPATSPTFPASAPRRRIDFVAVQGLEVVSAAVPEVPMSDHRPVVVEAGTAG
jgi:endonuclease/exonuclease/phosphatase family metal-dependent hydrolase